LQLKISEYKESNEEEYKKQLFRKIIEILPSSFIQSRTITTNLEVIYNIVSQRKTHKLTEWRIFCDIMSYGIPYYEELFEKKELNRWSITNI